jgi:hypothetical protein
MNANIKAPLDIVKAILLKPDITLRLNPTFYIKEIKACDKNTYALMLYNDRKEETCPIFINIEMSNNTISYKIDSSRIEFVIDEIDPAEIRLSIRGDFFNKDDLPYWLKGLKNYIQLEAKQSRIIKELLDKLWFRMTPSQRRITIIIIISEGISLIALIVVAIALKLLKS